jgi:hypothetical protein
MRASIARRVSAPGPSCAYIHSVRSERNTVGAMALRLIRCRPHSQASVLQSRSTAALEGL